MESQPQNPEFRNNPENFHPCISAHWVLYCLNRESYMNDHVLLNLLNKLSKGSKCEACQAF